MLVRRVHAAVERFATAHRDETFYAFAIDAGMQCLSSEEGFRRIIAKYRAHEAEDRIELDPAALPPERLEIERAGWEGECDFTDEPRSFEAYLAEAIEDHNARARRLANAAFTYDDPDKIASLRFRPGDWPYQGFAQLGDESLDALHEQHYDLGDAEQSTSDYALAMRGLITALRTNVDVVFASLRRGPEFRIFHAAHDY
jgi:hypothetical protein